MPQVTIRSIFNDAQRRSADIPQLIGGLLKIYKAIPYPVFYQEFCYHLKFSMIVYERHIAVENTINFIVSFMTNFANSLESQHGEEDSEDDEQEKMHPFLYAFFKFLLDSHKANHRAVRFRTCLLINKLLHQLGEDAQIDNEMYDTIQECMLVRMRDVCAAVRVQAAFALGRLQDPNEANGPCPIIEAYMYHLTYDPNSDVRRAILLKIAVSRRTLPCILERTRDVKDTVRKLALEAIADKVHVRVMTIAQRVKLLQDGLTDRVENVKKTCSTRLVLKWLSVFGEDITAFLRCLDVERSTDTCKLVLDSIFSQSQPQDSVKDFKLLNDRQVMPLDKLTCASVFYWHHLIRHCHGLGAEHLEQLDLILPTAAVFAEYLTSVFNEMKQTVDEDEQLENEFIMGQLLHLAQYIDTSDNFGRKAFDKIVRDMLLDDSTPHTLLQALLARFKELHTDPVKRVKMLVEIISDVRQPIICTQQPITEDQQRRMDVKLAGIRVSINELKEELASAVSASDYERAAEIKTKLHEMDKARQELLDIQPVASQVEERQEKNDPETLLYCLTITSEMLKYLSFTSLTPEIQTLVEVLVLPGIQNEDPAVRNMAVRSLGLCCLMDKELAQANLLLLTQISQIDQQHIRVSALHFIFDILHTFGLDVFEVNSECNQNGELDDSRNLSDSDSDDLFDEDDDDSDFEQTLSQRRRAAPKQVAVKAESLNTAGNLLNILVTNLNSECVDIRNVVAEGLAKLLLCGWITSYRLLSRLLLLWYNPITDDDTILRHCLGTFFTVYAFSSRANQEVVESAFMPTLLTVLEAPSTSPLAEVDVVNVAELLVQLTSEAHHMQPQDQTKERTSHENLTLSVCNHILSNPRAMSTRTMVRILNMFTITSNSIYYLKELRVLSRRMMKEVKDKNCVKYLTKFREHVRTLHNMARANATQTHADGDTSQDSQLETSQGEDNVFSPATQRIATAIATVMNPDQTQDGSLATPRPNAATPQPAAASSTKLPTTTTANSEPDDEELRTSGQEASKGTSAGPEKEEAEQEEEEEQEDTDRQTRRRKNRRNAAAIDKHEGSTHKQQASISDDNQKDVNTEDKEPKGKVGTAQTRGRRAGQQKAAIKSVETSPSEASTPASSHRSSPRSSPSASSRSTRTRASDTTSPRSSPSSTSTTAASTRSKNGMKRATTTRTAAATSQDDGSKKGKRSPPKRRAPAPSSLSSSQSDSYVTADENESSVFLTSDSSPATSSRITRKRPTPPKKAALPASTRTKSSKKAMTFLSDSDDDAQNKPDDTEIDVRSWTKARTTRGAKATTRAASANTTADTTQKTAAKSAAHKSKTTAEPAAKPSSQRTRKVANKSVDDTATAAATATTTRTRGGAKSVGAGAATKPPTRTSARQTTTRSTRQSKK